MAVTGFQSFQPVNTTHTSFDLTLSTASSATILQSSGRVFEHAAGRAIRFYSTGVDFIAQLGSSTVTAVIGQSMRVLGGSVEVINCPAHFTYVAVMTETTGVDTVNVTLGYGQ